VGHFPVVTQKKIRYLIKRYCNDLDFKLVFFLLQDRQHVWRERPYPWQASFVCGLKFACAGCNLMPVISAKQPGIFPHVRVEHLFSDKDSHVFKHVKNSQ